MATYLRVPVRSKTRFCLHPVKKAVKNHRPRPLAAHNKPRRYLPAPSRPTAGTARWIHLMGDSEALGWYHEASYCALWQVGGSSAAQLERAERRFRRTRTNLREYPRAFTTALPR